MRIIVTTIISFVFSVLSMAQCLEPMELAGKLFSKKQFKDIAHYSTEKFNGHPNGNDLNEGIYTTYRLLNQDDKKAVVNITFIDSIGKGFDGYLHLEKDSIWKITAFRALALRGMLEQVKGHLEGLTESERNKIISGNEEHKLFESEEDFNYQLGNLKLTIDLDDNIIAYFNDNKPKFDSLRKRIEKLKAENIEDKVIYKTHRNKFRELFLEDINTYNFIIGFTINGVIDNTVGYFYTSDKKNVPQMSPSFLIMIREIGDGWYMFKTT